MLLQWSELEAVTELATKATAGIWDVAARMWGGAPEASNVFAPHLLWFWFRFSAPDSINFWRKQKGQMGKPEQEILEDL